MTKFHFSIGRYFAIRLFPIIVLSLLFTTATNAQNLGHSPYSTYGIGDLAPTGLIRNIGMGNTGVSNGHSEFINFVNPALLPVSKGTNRDSTLKFTMMDVALNGVGRTITQGKESQTSGGVNLAYIHFLFPLGPNWSTAIGLRPYSSILNKYQLTSNVNDSTVKVTEYFSQGSLNQVSLDNGFDLTKNFSVGLHLAYLFGNTSHRNTAIFPKYISPFNNNQIGANYSDFNTAIEVKPGIAYRTEFKDSTGLGNGIFFNAGITYNSLLNGKIKRTRDLVFINTNNGSSNLNDSLKKTSHYSMSLPSEITGGFSFERTGKWTLAADLSYANWSVFKDIYGQSFLRDSYSIGLGGEWKPTKNLSLKSKEYRAGFTYTKLPLTIRGTQLDDYALSVGASIPVGRKDARYKSKPMNKINAALVLGTRGGTAGGLIHEQYFKLFLGVVIQDKWFQRWKID